MGRAQTPAALPVDLVAVEPIQHDGVRFEPGDPFAADPKSAQALLASGAATLLEAADGQQPLA